MKYEPTTEVELRAVKAWFLKNFPMPGWKVRLEFADDEDLRELTGTKHGDGATVYGCAAWESVERKAFAFVAEPETHRPNRESVLETCFHELGHIFWECEEPPGATTIPQERRLNTWAKVLARLYRSDMENTA